MTVCHRELCREQRCACAVCLKDKTLTADGGTPRRRFCMGVVMHTTADENGC